MERIARRSRHAFIVRRLASSPANRRESSASAHRTVCAASPPPRAHCASHRTAPHPRGDLYCSVVRTGNVPSSTQATRKYR